MADSDATSTDLRLQKGMVLVATILGSIFVLLGFIVFFGGWSTASDLTDDAFEQLLIVGQGAMPYFIAGGIFWFLAEYKTVHSD
jgi:hypothetical protein